MSDNNRIYSFTFDHLNRLNHAIRRLLKDAEGSDDQWKDAEGSDDQWCVSELEIRAWHHDGFSPGYFELVDGELAFVPDYKED